MNHTAHGAAEPPDDGSLRRLLALLPEPAWLCTPDRIGFLNAAAQRLFGGEGDRLVGQAPLALFDARSLASARALLHEAQAGRAPRAVSVLEVLRADGSCRTVEAAVSSIDGPGPRCVLVVMHDITHQRQAEDELRRSQAGLRRLAAAQDAVQQSERKRIARELHDELQQTLARIRLDLAVASQEIPQNPAAATALLAGVSDLALTAMGATRRIVNDLRPPVIDDLGLVAALEMLAEQFRRRTGLDCRFEAASHIDDDGSTIPPSLAWCLYRIAQEALENSARHAQATGVHMQLQSPGAGRLVLRIDDDGVGIQPGDWHKPGTLGVLGMHERARAAQAVLRVERRPGGGTTVEIDAGVPMGGPVQGSPSSPGSPGDNGDASLLQFLYRAPVGLVQARSSGAIEMLNPMATQLLMPLARDGRLDNLFDVLQAQVPELRTLVLAVDGPAGVVCDSLHVQLPGGAPRRGPQALSLSVLKQDGFRLMAVLSGIPTTHP